MIVRHREVPPTRVGVSDDDVDQVSLPVNVGTVGRVFEDGEDVFVGGTGSGLVIDGGKGVTALEEGGAHEELGDAEGGSLRVVGFEMPEEMAFFLYFGSKNGLSLAWRGGSGGSVGLRWVTSSTPLTSYVANLWVASSIPLALPALVRDKVLSTAQRYRRCADTGLRG